MYDLVNQAGITQLQAGAISDFSVPSVVAASLAPELNAMTLWWDQTTQLLKFPCVQVGNTTASLWLATGPDAWHFPGYNICTYTLGRGTLVRFDTAIDASIWDITPMEPVCTQATTGRMVRVNPLWRNLFGILQEDTPPHTFGPVLTYGIGKALVEIRAMYPLWAMNGYLLTGSLFLEPSSQYTGIIAPSCNPTAQRLSCFRFGNLLAGLGASPVTDLMWMPVWVQFPLGQRSVSAYEWVK
jgi:hypothetical protein